MTYGIYNPAVEDMGVRDVLKAKKISSEAICPVQKIDALLSRLQSGDTVWCASVRCFGSVSLYTDVAVKLFRGGVALRSVNEPYLDMGKGKCWKPQTEALLREIIQMEMLTVRQLASMKVNEAGRRQIIQSMQRHDIEVVARIFSGEGIMHR